MPTFWTLYLTKNYWQIKTYMSKNGAKAAKKRLMERQGYSSKELGIMDSNSYLDIAGGLWSGCEKLEYSGLQ